MCIYILFLYSFCDKKVLLNISTVPYQCCFVRDRLNEKERKRIICLRGRDLCIHLAQKNIHFMNGKTCNLFFSLTENPASSNKMVFKCTKFKCLDIKSAKCWESWLRCQFKVSESYSRNILRCWWYIHPNIWVMWSIHAISKVNLIQLACIFIIRFTCEY